MCKYHSLNGSITFGVSVGGLKSMWLIYWQISLEKKNSVKVIFNLFMHLKGQWSRKNSLLFTLKNFFFSNIDQVGL